ncbi:transposase, partial [bacterium]
MEPIRGVKRILGMGRPPRLQEPGQIFHVIVRGNRRQNIFEEEADWDRFQTALLRLAAESDFELLGFTLMGNHAHLLIRCGGTPLGKLLQGLLSSHALYLNKKYGRSGHLYQGRYTSEPCPNDSVLKHQLRYIHWNPVRAGLVRSPDEWKWSSHHAYCGQEMPGV